MSYMASSVEKSRCIILPRVPFSLGLPYNLSIRHLPVIVKSYGQYTYTQVTHSPIGRRIRHGYDTASFVAIRIGS